MCISDINLDTSSHLSAVNPSGIKIDNLYPYVHSLGRFSDQHFRSFLNHFLFSGRKERLKPEREVTSTGV